MYPFILGNLLTFWFNVTLSMTVFLVPLYAYWHSASPGQIGLLVALPGVFLVLLRIPGGLIASRWGERRVLLFSTFTGLLSSSLLYYASTFTLEPFLYLFWAQFVGGFSRAVFWPAAQSYVAHAGNGMVRNRHGIFNASASSGGLVGLVVAGFVIVQYGYSGAFLVLFILSGIGYILNLCLPRVSKQDQNRISKSVSKSEVIRDLKEALQVRPIYLAGISAFAAGSSFGIILYFFPIHFTSIGFSEDVSGILTSTRGLAVALSSLAVEPFLRQSRRALSLQGTLLLTGLGLVVVSMAGEFQVIFLAMLVLGISAAVLQTLPMQLATDYGTEKNLSTLMAIQGTFWSFSLLITPLFFGFVAEYLDLGMTILISGVFFIALALVSKRMYRYFVGGIVGGKGIVDWN